MEKMEKQLELASQTSLSREDVVSDKFDRPNLEIRRVTSKKFVNQNAVELAITPWLVGICKIDANMVKFTCSKDCLLYTFPSPRDP